MSGLYLIKYAEYLYIDKADERGVAVATLSESNDVQCCK